MCMNTTAGGAIATHGRVMFSQRFFSQRGRMDQSYVCMYAQFVHSFECPTHDAILLLRYHPVYTSFVSIHAERQFVLFWRP